MGLFGRKKIKEEEVAKDGGVNIDNIPEPPMVEQLRKGINAPPPPPPIPNQIPEEVTDKTLVNDIHQEIKSKSEPEVNNYEEIDKIIEADEKERKKQIMDNINSTYPKPKEEKVEPKEEKVIITPPVEEPVKKVEEVQSNIGNMPMQVVVQKVTIERFFHNGRFIGEKEVGRQDVVKEVQL